MDEREFMRMLERFPVVRKSTHCRVVWNSIYDDDASSQARPAAAAAQNESTIVINENASLREALDLFCRQYFSYTDSLKIYGEFEKAQRDFMAGLCLEDIDDICAQFVQ